MDIKFEDGVIKTPEIDWDENCGGIGNIYFNAFRKYSHRVALINTSNDEYYTYAEFLKCCIRTAIELKNRGLKKGDTIAICSYKENLNANVPIIAGQFLGLITFSLDPELTVDGCAELVGQVEPKMVFTTEKAQHMINKSLQVHNAKSELVLFETTFKTQYLKEQIGEETFQPVFINNLKETCVIHFSSGSTGLPKPICLNHYYFWSLLVTTNRTEIPERPCKPANNKPIGMVSLRFANWYWVSTSFEMIFFMSKGACRLLWEKYDHKQIWCYLDKYSVTNLCLTPLQCVELTMTTKPEGTDLSSFVDLMTGGYLLHKDYMDTLRKLLPNTFVYQTYGMTETGIVTTFNNKIPDHLRLSAEKTQSCGLPIPGLWFKVVDLDTGKKCGPNEQGELYIKGKAVFNGFYNKAALENFDKEGYFRTGDLVFFDEDFCFYVLDRIKQFLGWRDYVIYPYHVEKVLLSHPSVFNAVVIGIPHKIDGDVLMAVVIPKKDAPKVTAEELVKYVDKRVEDHKRLRAGVRFMREFPVTITGKISRIKIKEKVLNSNVTVTDIP